jgi:hypothetical protein
LTNKKNKRPSLTPEEKKKRDQLRKEKSGTTSSMGLLSVGNRGQPPTRFTPEYLEKLKKDLTEWSLRPKTYFIERFCADYVDDITISDLNEMCTKNPLVFAPTYYRVRLRLLFKLKEDALKKELDGNFCAKILPLIDPEYKKWQQEIMKLSAEGSAEKTLNVKIIPGVGLLSQPDTVEIVEEQK